MTWDRRLYFPSERRRAEDFFALKNPTASAGVEPTNLGTKGQHATPRPPKPLGFRVKNWPNNIDPHIKYKVRPLKSHQYAIMSSSGVNVGPSQTPRDDAPPT
jgi:hypothetical protein